MLPYIEKKSIPTSLHGNNHALLDDWRVEVIWNSNVVNRSSEWIVSRTSYKSDIWYPLKSAIRYTMANLLGKPHMFLHITQSTVLRVMITFIMLRFVSTGRNPNNLWLIWLLFLQTKNHFHELYMRNYGKMVSTRYCDLSRKIVQTRSSSVQTDNMGLHYGTEGRSNQEISSVFHQRSSSTISACGTATDWRAEGWKERA